jgi:glycerophosphoryl diester phosphodiesterase
MRSWLAFVVVAGMACGDNASPLCPIAAQPGTSPPPFRDVLFVAHAFGSPLGLLQLEHYTESREAFDISYRNGFRAYEIDLLQLGDGTVAAVHDKDEAKYGVDAKFSEITRADLEGRKWNGKYEVLFVEDIVDILVQHPDIWLILDTKCCHEAIAREFIELAPDDSARDRIVPHVTSAAHAAALPSVYPFPEKLYARYWWDGSDDDVLDRMQAYNIDNAMMWWDSRWNETLQTKMEAAGHHVWVHTPADPDQIEDFVARGVGVYTDGYITCE